MKKQINFLKVQYWVLLVVICTYSTFSYGQSLTLPEPDNEITCGTNADFFGNFDVNIGSPMGLTAPSLMSPASIIDCGIFDLYYEDINSATGKGFDDHTAVVSTLGSTLGEVRQATLCAVLTYIQSIFDFSGCTSGQIRLYISQSYAPGTSLPAVPGIKFLARASPYFTSVSGITAGWVNQYAVTGVDPAPSGSYHGYLQVNFDQTWPVGATYGSTINWHSDYTTTGTSCIYDLYSSLLHEMGHVLGWMSFVQFTSSTVGSGACGCVYGTNTYTATTPIQIPGLAANLFTKLDTAITAAPVGVQSPSSLRHLVVYNTGTSLFEINPVAYGCQMNYWINTFAAPNNYPVYSGEGQALFDTSRSKSFLSHLDGIRLVYTFRERISPGDRQNYSMIPIGIPGDERRQFTKGEIRSFVNTIGYSYIGSDLFVLPNTPPYSQKMAGMTINQYTYHDQTETVTPDYTLVNNTGASLTIDLSDACFTTADLIDPDMDAITIDGATIANLRGCGSGGNNHNNISWTGAFPTTITFTPRANFYGKAQIGFNVTDGKERGSYRVVTIEVLRGSNVSPALSGGNMVCNPDFEEGSEIMTEYDQTKPYYYLGLYHIQEGNWQGVCFSDSHPYMFNSSKKYSSVTFPIQAYYSGAVVSHSFISCSVTVSNKPSGSLDNSSPMLYGIIDNPVSATSGDRYQTFLYPGESYYYLNGDVTKCKKYILSFDIYKTSSICPSCSPSLDIKFTNTINTTVPIFEYSLPTHTFPTIAGTWVRDTLEFWYCGDPSNIMYIGNPAGTYFHIDNLELVENTSPPAMGVSVATAVVGPGSCHTVLTPTITEPGCAPTYAWSPASGLSCTSCAIPDATPTATTTYMLTVKDACGFRTASTTVTVSPILTPIIGPTALCVGEMRFLSDATSGGTWSSSNPSVATISTGAGMLTGISGGTTTISYILPSGCYITSIILVSQTPAPIIGSSSVCEGSTLALSDAVSGGTWSSSNPSVATIGISSGVLSGVSGGTTVVTYAMPGGCIVIKTITVNSLPAVITGSPSVCVGLTTTLSTSTSGGTWTSSNPGVATVSFTGVVTGASAGTATITYTLPTGCFRTFTISVLTAPASIVGASTVCEGASVSLSNASPGGTWSSSNPIVGSISSLGAVTGVSSGIVTITYSIGTGCISVHSMTVYASPSGITGTTTVCSGLAVTLSNAVTGGTWTSGSPSVATVGTGDGIVSGVSPGTAVITYTLPGGCYATTSVSITSPGVIVGATVICEGTTTTLSDPAGAGTWTSSTPGVATIGTGSGIVTGVSVGTTTITFTAGTGCYALATMTVISSPSDIIGPTSLCLGGTTTFSDADGGGVWSSSSPTVGSIDPTTGVVTPISAGTTTISYTFGTGCTATISVTVNPLPAAITGASAVCEGVFFTLSNTTAGGTWSSSAPAIAPIVSSTGVAYGLSAGTAVITYMLPTGCYVTRSVTINPVPGPITGSSYVCVSSSTTLSSPIAGGVWTTSNWAVATVGSSTGIVSGVGAYTVTITYTLGTGCYSTHAMTVMPLPSAILGPTSVCVGSTMTLIDLTPGGTWSSSNTGIATAGSATGIITGVSAGSVTIAYTDAYGCSAYLGVVVNPLPAAITGVSTMCAWGSHIMVSDATPGGVWSSSLVTITPGRLVSSFAPGTAWIYYTLPTGCMASASLTVLPVPAVITGSGTVCIGTTITLSDADPGGSWSSSNPAIGSVDASTGAVRGISAGSVVITYMFGTGCFVTKSVNVGILPIAGPSVVCEGSSITLSDPTTGGTWSSSVPGTATVGSLTGIVTGVSAGTTVISYTTVCGSVTRTITVNPTPVAITGLTSLCYGGTTILSDATAGGTWSSSNPSIAAIGSTRVVTATSAGTAVITYRLPAGCYVTTSVTVYGSGSCPCTVGTTAFTTLDDTIMAPLGSGRYYIPNNTLIFNPGSSLTFSNSLVVVDAAVQLDVDWSTELILTGAHLYGCSSMWQGLVLQPEPATPPTISARIQVTGGTLIEDATTAIYAQDPVNTGAGNIVETDNAIFNRNITGVRIENYIPLEATYPFVFKNTVFTSRNFSAYVSGASTYPNVWPSTTASPKGLKYAWSPATAYDPPFNIDNPTMSYSVALCKNAAPAETGIKLNGVGTYSTTVTTGVPVPSFYAEVQIGDETPVGEANPNMNLFDNLKYGVYAENTNFTCVNNVFAHLKPYNRFSVPSAGNGVYCKVTDDYNNHNRMRVYTPSGSTFHNRFYDFYMGVASYNYFNVIGNNCEMVSKGPSTVPSPIGGFGYVVKSMHYDLVEMNLNTITNVMNGIVMWSTYDPMVMPTWPYVYKGRCNINGNTLQACLTTYSVTMTQRMQTGISVQNALSYLSTTTTSGLGFTEYVHVDYNNILDVENGIYVNGYFDQAVVSNLNNIRQRLSPGGGRRLQFGINHSGSRSSAIFGNDVTASSTSLMSDSSRAYFAANNLGLNIGCNDEDHIGRGYEFFLNNLGTAWHDNTIEASYKGMVLNAAKIGPQRYMGFPMNNTWVGSWGGSTPHTYVYHGADAATSPFYVNNIGGKIPTNNSGDLAYPHKFYSSATINTVSATYTSTVCPTGPVGYHGNPEMMVMFEDIAQDHVAYPYAAVPHKWIAQYELWKAILLDSTIIDSSAVMAAFASMGAVSRYAYLADIEYDLAQGDFASATIKLGFDIDSMANTSYDSVTGVEMTDGTGANYIVENYQQFYGLYIKYMDATLTTSDSLAIMGLANLCPELNGSVVYQARALYSDLYLDLTVFNDDSCLDVDTTYIADRRSNPDPNPGLININSIQQNYAIYPNPNDGNFELLQMMADKDPVMAEVFDVVGRSVGKEKIIFNTPTTKLHVGNVSPGIYVLQLTDSKKRIFKFKFVIER